MVENLLIGLLGLAGSVITYFLGSRDEKKKQSLLIRSKVLDPIENWVKGTEKIIGILNDTIVAVSQGSPIPITYNFEERRRAAQFMVENTNEVMGILESRILQTKKTKELSDRLSNLVRNLDGVVKYEILPSDNKILEMSNRHLLSEDFFTEIIEKQKRAQELIVMIYTLISQIRTKLID